MMRKSLTQKLIHVQANLDIPFNWHVGTPKNLLFQYIYKETVLDNAQSQEHDQ